MWPAQWLNVPQGPQVKNQWHVGRTQAVWGLPFRKILSNLMGDKHKNVGGSFSSEPSLSFNSTEDGWAAVGSFHTSSGQSHSSAYSRVFAIFGLLRFFHTQIPLSFWCNSQGFHYIGYWHRRAGMRHHTMEYSWCCGAIATIKLNDICE